MKRYIYTIALLAILFIAGSLKVSASSVAEVANDTAVVTASGKFNRGLSNHLFIPKNKWMFGLTASYSSYDSQDNDILLLLKDFNFAGSLFGVHPYAGYFIADNQCVGIKLGYSSTIGNLGQINLNLMDGLNISLPDMNLNSQVYSAGIFHRAYLGLSQSGQFAVFNETNLTFQSGLSHFTRGNAESGMQDTKTIANEIALTLCPGISVLVMDHVSANVSVGILGLNYRECKQYINEQETGKYYASGANFKINILNINIGITVHI